VTDTPGRANAVGRFEEIFDAPATYMSRAPGRVNLIGEHIDYNGLAVLPMALQKEIRIVLRPRDDERVVLHNVDPSFEPVDFEIGPAIQPGPGGHWGNYVRAPAHELARRFAIWRGFDGVVESTLPTAAGLSSSSALVIAVGLALAQINEVSTEPLAFAEVMASAERFVGTEGGGMDQAISLGARARYAARISFDPVRLRHVGVPEEWCFVIADTGERAEKSGPVQAAYNLRRKECAEAFRIVSGHVATADITSKLATSYPDLLGMLDVATILAAADAVLDGPLRRRFRHVVTEAGRVEEGVDALRAADVGGFGLLMDASHGSLRTDFGVSSPELDELVAIAREGGARGARLTGAGFGGSIVALADRWTVGGVLETLVSEYFEPRGLADDIDERLFIAVPSAGATLEALGA
jgi:galactokinase